MKGRWLLRCAGGVLSVLLTTLLVSQLVSQSSVEESDFPPEFLRLLDGPLRQDSQELVRYIKGTVAAPAPPSSEYHFEELKQVEGRWTGRLGGQFEEMGKVLGILQKKKGGFFIECGALNGEYLSNSLVLELEHGWSGILIEADPVSFAQLTTRNRRAHSLNACLSPSPFPQRVQFEVMADNAVSGVIGPDGRSQRARQGKFKNVGVSKVVGVQCFPLYSILLALGNPTVDYFSLDVEGAEQGILETIPWDKVDIRVVQVELAHSDQQAVRRVMEGAGYTAALTLKVDMVFVKKGVKMSE